MLFFNCDLALTFLVATHFWIRKDMFKKYFWSPVMSENVNSTWIVIQVGNSHVNIIWPLNFELSSFWNWVADEKSNTILILAPLFSVKLWNLFWRLEFWYFTTLSPGVSLFHSLCWAVGISFLSEEWYLLALRNYIVLFLWLFVLLYFIFPVCLNNLLVRCWTSWTDSLCLSSFFPTFYIS